MRQGGSPAKGSAWERSVGRSLSHWLTHGERDDLFSRNVLSGGKFTIAAKSGQEKGVPGDLAAQHPIAYTFLKRFSIECKHYKKVGLTEFLVKGLPSHFLAKAIAQASVPNRIFMLIVKQNNCPAFVIMPQSAWSRLQYKRGVHMLDGGNYLMLAFDQLLKLPIDRIIV